jgi:hypothetical protein
VVQRLAEHICGVAILSILEDCCLLVDDGRPASSAHQRAGSLSLKLGIEASGQESDRTVQAQQPEGLLPPSQLEFPGSSLLIVLVAPAHLCGPSGMDNINIHMN